LKLFALNSSKQKRIVGLFYYSRNFSLFLRDCVECFHIILWLADSLRMWDYRSAAVSTIKMTNRGSSNMQSDLSALLCFRCRSRVMLVDCTWWSKGNLSEWTWLATAMLRCRHNVLCLTCRRPNEDCGLSSRSCRHLSTLYVVATSCPEISPESSELDSCTPVDRSTKARQFTNVRCRCLFHGVLSAESLHSTMTLNRDGCDAREG